MSTTVSTVTLDYMVSQCLKRAKMERSNFVDTDTVREMLRASIRSLYDLLVAAFEDYHRTTLDESTVILDAAGTYTLPDDFYKLRGVDCLFSGGVWQTLQEVPWNERNRYAISPSGWPVGYLLLGRDAFGKQQSYLQVLPATSVQTTGYRVYYTPKPSIPVNGNDKIDGINGWEEYPICDVTALILEMASRDNRRWTAQCEMTRERIRVMSKKRNTGQAHQSALTQERGWPWAYGSTVR